MNFNKQINDEISHHADSIVSLLGLDPALYRVNISIVTKEQWPKFQELKR